MNYLKWAALVVKSIFTYTNKLDKVKSMKTIIIMLFTSLFILCCTKKKIELPKYHEIPAFSLTNENGATITNQDLKGKVYLANFVFTTCQASCPLTMTALSRIQDRLPAISPSLKIVTITVDPETDTPEVLKAKAAEYKAKPEIWMFLTGKKDKVFDLVTNGFKVVMNKADVVTDTAMDIAHSNKFILVDQNATIRGIYSNTDREQVEQMLEDMKSLISQ